MNAPTHTRLDHTKLNLDRNPLRLLASSGPWRAAWYLAGYVFVTGWVLFSIAFTATVSAAVFAITLAGIPLAIAAAAVVRWCAAVERVRLRQVFAGPLPGAGYRSTDGLGLMARARATWKDPALWRDGAYVIGLWTPLFILDTVVLTIWLTFLAGITVPIWYWAPRGTGIAGYTSSTTVHGLAFGYFPHGPHGPGGVGLFVDSVPTALLTAACFLVLFLIFNYVVVLTARAHARVALSLLRAPADPLARAKEVLAGPGPLGPLQKNPVPTTKK
jgi:Putative sensor